MHSGNNTSFSSCGQQKLEYFTVYNNRFLNTGSFRSLEWMNVKCIHCEPQVYSEDFIFCEDGPWLKSTHINVLTYSHWLAKPL